MNAAGATTITVNTGLFAAGDTVFIQNLGAGACTVTAGTATVATAGSLILPQNDAGILYFTAAGASIFYDFIQAGAVSPLTTKGDVYTFSTSDARIGVGANNTVLTADTAEATGLKWAAPAGGGKVLQVVSTTYSTSTTIASTSLTDTGLTLNITPTSATSKVLVLVDLAIQSERSGNGFNTYGAILRGATNIYDLAVQELNASGGSLFNRTPMIYLDSPATTSATTYKVQIRCATTANSQASFAQYTGRPSSITLMEIGA
jgi:hypothetical protein